MRKLEQLPEIAETSLQNLTAGNDLKFRIITSAAENKQVNERNRFRTVIPVICASLIVMIALLGIFNAFNLSASESPSVTMNNYSAGASVDGHPEEIARILENSAARQSRICSISITGIGTINDPVLCADLFHILISDSEFVGKTTAFSGEAGMLVITTEKGETLSFPLQDTYLYDNGIWDCKQFVQTFLLSLE